MVKVSTVTCDKFDYNTGGGTLHVEKYSDGKFYMYGVLTVLASNRGTLKFESPFTMSNWSCAATPMYSNYPDLVVAASLDSGSIRIDLTKNEKGTPEMDNMVNIIVIGRWK